MSELIAATEKVPYLPPQEIWLYNPRREGRVPTPVDERGIVDANQLIDLGMSMVSSDYNWQEPFALNQRRPFNDPHHLHWPKTFYVNDDVVAARDFRNLHINQVQLPRVFHNWLHHATEPPPVPEDDVMHHYIEAQQVVVTLFHALKQSKRTLRNPRLSERQIEHRLVRQLDIFNETVTLHSQLPPEFQYAHIANYRGASIDDMLEPQLVRHLGKLATTPTAIRRVNQLALVS